MPLLARHRATAGLACAGLVLGLVLAWVATGFDLAGALARPLGTYNGDSIRAFYLHDQVHDALLAGRLTLSDPNQLVPIGFHPVGTHGGNSLEMLVSGAARLVAGWPAWWSLGALAWIPLNLLAALPLGAHLWPRKPVVSLSMAAAWAVSPVLLGQLNAGRLTQVAVVGVPLAVLGMLQISESGGRRAIALTAVGMALSGLGYWFNAVFLAFVATLFVAWGARRRGLGPVGGDFARAALGATLIVAPFLGVVLWERFGHGQAITLPLSAEFTSPDFPDALRISGEQAAHVRGWMPGVVALGACVGLVRGRRRPLWAGAAAVCTIFALGPGQHLGDHLWLLPSYPVWRWLPGMDAMSHPERWLVPAALFWLVLASDGLARCGRAGLVLPLILPVGVLAVGHRAEHLPLPTFDMRVPAVWRDLAAHTPGATVPGVESPPASDAPVGAAIVLPIGQAQDACAWQPFVGRPLLGGMIENQPWYRPPQWVAFINGQPFLRGLAALSSGQDRPVALHQSDIDTLRGHGFGVVVYDEALWRARFGAGSVPVQARLEAALGPPVFSDGSGAWWALPAVGQPGTASLDEGFTFGENGPPGADPKAAGGR